MFLYDKIYNGSISDYSTQQIKYKEQQVKKKQNKDRKNSNDGLLEGKLLIQDRSVLS